MKENKYLFSYLSNVIDTLHLLSESEQPGCELLPPELFGTATIPLKWNPKKDRHFSIKRKPKYNVQNCVPVLDTIFINNNHKQTLKCKMSACIHSAFLLYFMYLLICSFEGGGGYFQYEACNINLNFQHCLKSSQRIFYVLFFIIKDKYIQSIQYITVFPYHELKTFLQLMPSVNLHQTFNITKT